MIKKATKKGLKDKPSLNAGQAQNKRPGQISNLPVPIPNEPEEQGEQHNDIKLTEQQLNEELPTRMLIPVNPCASRTVSVYDFLDRKYKTSQLTDHTVMHFSMDGDLIHTTSNDYKTQESIEETRKLRLNEFRQQAESEEPGSGRNIQMLKQTMRNKFNYNSREVQTTYPSIKEQGASTCPPSTDLHKKEVTTWDIWDSYIQMFKKETSEDKQTGKQPPKKKEQLKEKGLYSASFQHCLKIMERIVLMNKQKDNYATYKNQPEEGDPNSANQIKPVWTFSYMKNKESSKKNRHVTSICWNPRYPDLFACSIGSYAFNNKNRNGQILIWSLKNVEHPEYIFNNQQPVMCLDFHPKTPALLAVGLYDGTVLVYDIRNRSKKPIYTSTVRTQKHTDPVWQVRWNPDVTKHNFFSISSDGRVMNWSLMKNKLEPEEVFRLRLVGKNEEESTLIGLACGLCFDFSKFDSFTFLVGTEQGKIHKCSRAYSGQYQETYSGHLLAVYKVRWNTYHPRTFISASADWTVKIWDSASPSQVMSFDLSSIVVDVVWAPYSSTVFVCSNPSVIYVYDLYQDKHSKIGEYKPQKNKGLTNLCFNYKSPILLMGNSTENVFMVKLGPNLTRCGQPPTQEKKEEKKETKEDPKKAKEEKKKEPEVLTGAALEENEKQKMENILGIVSKWERE